MKQQLFPQSAVTLYIYLCELRCHWLYSKSAAL